MNILCTGIHQAFQYIAHGFSGTVIDICFQLINCIFRKTAVWFRGFNQHGPQNAWAFIGAFSGTNADTGNLKLFRELPAGSDGCGNGSSSRCYKFTLDTGQF